LVQEIVEMLLHRKRQDRTEDIAADGGVGGGEPVEHDAVEPDQALVLRAAFALKVDGAERERRGDRVEGFRREAMWIIGSQRDPQEMGLGGSGKNLQLSKAAENPNLRYRP
jgi:hypothetical protein